MEKLGTKSNPSALKQWSGKGAKAPAGRSVENPGSGGATSRVVKNPGKTGDSKAISNDDQSSANNSVKSEENKKKQFSEYKRESTVFIQIEGDSVTKDDVLDHIEALCGEDSIMACVPRGSVPTDFEVTLTNTAQIQLLVPEFEIGETKIKARPIFQSAIVVSVMHLPSYTTDEEITQKIESHKVKIVSPIYRRYYKRKKRRIADGTRYMRVKFPKDVCSLPYAMKFDVNGSKEYFRTLHSDQIKVCNRCLSPEHMVRFCDQNQCFICKERGHISLDCPRKVCEDCKRKDCVCDADSEKDDDGVLPEKKVRKINDEQAGADTISKYLLNLKKTTLSIENDCGKEEEPTMEVKESKSGNGDEMDENPSTDEEMDETTEDTSPRKETVFGDVLDIEQPEGKQQNNDTTEANDQKTDADSGPSTQRPSKRKTRRDQIQPYHTKSKNTNNNEPNKQK